MSITLPARAIHCECRVLTPRKGKATVGAETVMASYWRTGQHAHIVLRHGTLGVGCGVECHRAGVHDWRP
jgi:hypothetical protein